MRAVIEQPQKIFGKFGTESVINLTDGLTKGEYYRYIEYDIIMSVLKRKRIN